MPVYTDITKSERILAEFDRRMLYLQQVVRDRGIQALDDYPDGVAWTVEYGWHLEKDAVGPYVPVTLSPRQQ